MPVDVTISPWQIFEKGLEEISFHYARIAGVFSDEPDMTQIEDSWTIEVVASETTRFRNAHSFRDDEVSR